MSGHARKDASDSTAGRLDAETLPGLNLVCVGARSLFDELEPGHPLYMLAAWTYHHGHQIMPFDVRRGFYEALSRVWPGRVEQKGNSRERVRLAYLLDRRGVSKDEIAAALNVSVAAVEKYLRRGRDRFEAEPASPHEIVPNPRPHGATEPPDPGAAADLIWLWLPLPSSDECAAEAAAIEKANELGIDLFSADDG